MDFDTFAKDKAACYTTEDGFLLWKPAGGEAFAPCRLDGDGGNLISHILVCHGWLEVSYGDDADDARHTLPPGSFASFIDRPVLRLLAASPDVEAYVMVCRDAYIDALLKNTPPVPFSFVVEARRSPVNRPDGDTLQRFRLRMENICEVCRDTDNLFRDKMIKCAIWMLMMDIADRYIRSGGHRDPEDRTGRGMQLFTGFMRLLPTYAATERFAAFYAARLNVTPQYLNRVVKAFSNRTVTGWISFTLVGEITKRLESTHDSMQQIAQHFHFPDQATLAKFYKRETGYSLTEYRRKLR